MKSDFRRRSRGSRRGTSSTAWLEQQQVFGISHQGRQGRLVSKAGPQQGWWWWLAGLGTCTPCWGLARCSWMERDDNRAGRAGRKCSGGIWFSLLWGGDRSDRNVTERVLVTEPAMAGRGDPAPHLCSIPAGLCHCPQHLFFPALCWPGVLTLRGRLHPLLLPGFSF